MKITLQIKFTQVWEGNYPGMNTTYSYFPHNKTVKHVYSRKLSAKIWHKLNIHGELSWFEYRIFDF